MRIKKEKLIFYFFALILSVLIVYHQLPYSFFQQDEWLSFGRRITFEGMGWTRLIREAFSPTVGHFNPLNFVTLNWLIRLFGLNYAWYALVSLFLHSLAAILVFYLGLYLSKDYLFSFLSSLLFAVWDSSAQATTWVLADVGYHGATICSLVGIIMALKLTETHSFKYFIMSPMFLLFSVLFKEITVAMFVIIPLAILIFDSRKIKQKWLLVLPYLGIGTVYLFFRLASIFLPQSYRLETVVTKTQSLSQIAVNLRQLPIRSIAQSTIPLEVWRTFYDRLQINLELPTLEAVFASTPLTIIGLFFILVVVGLWFKNRQDDQGKIIIFSLSWMILNSLVFVFSPERSKELLVIDSRYLYFISIGTIFLIVSLTRVIFKKKILTVVILAILLGLNGWFLERKINSLAEEGQLRKAILNKIKTSQPSLPPKVIFYTESDSSFYGLSPNERIFPFQSGIGQILLVWYHTPADFPKSFFQNKFLWDLNSQGYQEVGLRGFGYFHYFNQLVDYLQDYQLPIESIVSFSYDSKMQITTDNTDEVRGRIRGYLAKKQKIMPAKFTATTINNPQGVKYMLDNNRVTYWDSKLPYVNPQMVQIAFTQPLIISQINIDVYQNQDQNEVGYSVSLSNDGINWERVFYAKRYPPGADGVTEIPFLPKSTLFVKIEQVGWHEYASWVISELNLYESIN